MSGVHPCPVCQRYDYRPLHFVRGTAIVCCRGCGLATWAWPTFEPREFYDASYWRSADIGKGYADYFALADALRATNAARARLLRGLLAREVRSIAGAAGSLLEARGSFSATPLPPGKDLGEGRALRCGRLVETPAPMDPGSEMIARSPATPQVEEHSRRLETSATVREQAFRVLDVGCGPGYFLQAAVGAGFAARGVEASEFAARFAREQLGLEVRHGLARREDLGEEPCDVVTMWDVIEHVPDPRASLSAAAAVTRPGGLLALSTGDRSSLVARLSGRHWHLYNLPEHLWFFTSSGLRRLLREVGFAPIRVAYEVCWYPLRYLVERLEASLRLGRGLSGRLGPLGRAALPVTLGDIVTIVARRA